MKLNPKTLEAVTTIINYLGGNNIKLLAGTISEITDLTYREAEDYCKEALRQGNRN